MWSECHQRSAWKYQYAECNYTLFFSGPATLRRRTSPVLLPQQTAPHKALLGFTRVACSEHQAGSKAEQQQVAWTSSCRPSGGAFFLDACRRVTQSFSSEEFRYGRKVAKNTIPTVLKHVTHLLLFIKLLLLRERLFF